MAGITSFLISIGIAAGAVALGVALDFIVSFFLSKRHSRKPFTFKGLRLNLGYWRGPLAAILPALCLALSTPLLNLPGRTAIIFGKGLSLWLIAAFSWLIVRTIAMAREIILSRFDVEATDNLEARRISTQIRVFERVLVSVVVVLTIALMLMTFQTVRQIGLSILASAVVIGLVIGFAVQRSLATILGGLQIAITQPIRLEDAVLVEGEWGWIEEITLTFVVVKLWDQRRLIVPITHFIEKPFQNWTRTASELKGSGVFIYADYCLSIPEVRSELQRVVRSTDLWDGRVCNLQVTNVTNEGVELRALASAADSSQTWDLRCYIREHILDFIKNNFPESLPRTHIKLSRTSRHNGDAKGRRIRASVPATKDGQSLGAA